jgi:hypothetical protein
MQNEMQATKILGIDKNYFYTMKCTNKDKYNYMSELDNNAVKAYKKYFEEHEEIQREIDNIYYELLDTRGIYRFSRYLYDNGIYKHRNTFSTVVGKYVGKIEPVYNHRAFMRLKKVIKAYKEYINGNTN